MSSLGESWWDALFAAFVGTAAHPTTITTRFATAVADPGEERLQ